MVTKRERKAAEALAATHTFEKLAREWYDARKPRWEEGTARRIIGALELHVFPAYGPRPFTDIMPIEWMEFLRGMERKGIIDQMGNVRRFCKEIYDLARVTGRATHNPLEGLHRFLQTKPAKNYAHVSPPRPLRCSQATRAAPGYSWQDVSRHGTSAQS